MPLHPNPTPNPTPRSTIKCEMKIAGSVCNGSPCANGGTCSVTATGDVSCTCTAGYSGDACSGKFIPLPLNMPKYNRIVCI